MSPKTNEKWVEDAMKLAADKTGSLRWQCKELQERTVDGDTWKRTQIVSKTALNRLTKARIRDLNPEEQNAGKCVLVLVLDEGYTRTECSWFNMVMDEEGLIVGLVLYNYPLNELFAAGTRLIIKEPYCTYKLGFPFFRCDCPTDILVLLPADPKAESEAWRNHTQHEVSLTSDPFPRTSDEWRARGDHLRELNKLVLAREAYSFGRQMCGDDDPNLEPILLNLLEVQFFLGYYEWVVEEAKKLPNEERAHLLMGKAYFKLRQYEDAISTFQNLTEKFKRSKLSVQELHLLKLRVKQFQSKANVYKLQQLSEDKPHIEIDCADSSVSVNVVGVGGSKGRGVILNEDVKKRDVLMVAKAIAATLNCDEFRKARWRCRDETQTQNAGNKWKDGIKANDNARLHRMRVVSKLTKLVLQNPTRFGSLVFDLYSKKYADEQVQLYCDSEAKTERVCDVDWLNDIYAYNGFALIDTESRLIKGYGIFDLPSYLNHNCEPNVDCEFLNNVMVVRALEDLPAGTELTLNYGLPEMKYQERTDYLKERGFVCNCRKCEKRI